MKNGEYILVKAPKNFPGKKYRGRYCYQHVLVFWQNFGIIPKSDEIVHHIDGNKTNNTPSNLRLEKRSNHSRQHDKERGITFVKLICPGCQKEFSIEKRQSYLTKKNEVSCCSRRCIGIYTGLSEEQKQIRKKQMYIAEYKKYERA